MRTPPPPARVSLGATPLARGRERACYPDPRNPARIIKVCHEPAGKQQRRELRYFRHLARRGVPWRHLPAFHGAVETDRGTGLVFDLVRDYDGRPSPHLEAFIAADGLQGIAGALAELKAHYARWNIITCDMSLGNFLVRRTAPETIELVMIDGVGNREFIPFSSAIAALGRVKMRRRWRRFDRKLERRFGLRPPAA